MTEARRRPRIALIVNFLDSAYQMSLRTAIGRVAARRGIDLIVAIGRALDHEDENERALNVIYGWLTRQSVDGAIVVAAAISNYVGNDGVAQFCRVLAPLPTCSIGLALPGIPSIVLDNRVAMRRQVSHLAEHHRCRRIAFVAGPSHNDEARDRLAGYRDALEAAGIAFDGALVEAGQFSMPTGRRAMMQILERTRDIDAVVAANDYMALGAMDELAARGIRVPEDVLVMGFDDAPVARFARRSLSTAAQPIEEMAERAVDVILESMRGGSVKLLRSLDAQLMPRESCGCGYVVQSSVGSLVIGAGRAADYLRGNQSSLRAEVLQYAGAAHDYWASFLDDMIASLAEELSGRRGVFLRSVEQIAERMSERETSLDEVARALVQLRRSCRNAGYPGADHIAFEEVCMRALALLSSAATRREGRRALRVMDGAYGLRRVTQSLATGLNPAGVARNFGSIIPTMGIDTACLAILEPGKIGLRLRTLLAVASGAQLPLEPAPYPAVQLLPNGFPGGDSASCLLCLPLTFERQVLGLVVFGGEADPFVCEAIRSQLSASLELGALHARIVEETTLRERLAREQLLLELTVARRIQTALIPRPAQVPGLEIAAHMLPADQVGGDYYDIFNMPDGCWMAIGDVTGHGLLAGMIMLMMQTAVSTLVTTLPGASPAQLVCRLNRVMRSNIRERLNESDHATFVILRYHSGGAVALAGAHDEIVIYRAGSGRCERVSPEGVWLGIADDIEEYTPDQHFRLERGDLLLLYTDGLIEARSADGEEFGLERVEQILRASAQAGVAEIQGHLLAAVRAWTPVQQDDVTLIVARQT